MVFGILLCAFMIASQHSTAQVAKDTLLTNALKDTTVYNNTLPSASGDTVAIPVKPKPFQPNPKKAGLYSSIVPGLGQLYNRQYWKIPVIYAGIGIAGYFFLHNLDNYQSYRKAYINRINNPNYIDKYTGIYDGTQLQQLQSDYNKYLDLTVLFSAIGYTLEVIDAITSAHLKNFEVSRDISLHIKPAVLPNGAGMALVVNFK